MASKAVLVTGAAGFIGMQVCERLLARGEAVVGVDSLTPYYDPALKRARLNYLRQYAGFSFHETDLADAEGRPDLRVEGSGGELPGTLAEPERAGHVQGAAARVVHLREHERPARGRQPAPVSRAARSLQRSTAARPFPRAPAGA